MTGTEISVYCIVPAAKQGFTTRYALTFLLDKEPDGGQWPQPQDPIDTSKTNYNVLVYHKAGLARNMEHQLWVRAENDEADSIIIFDYAKIVTGDGDEPTSTDVQPTLTPTTTVSPTSTSKTTTSSTSSSTIITTPASTRSTTSATGSSSVTTLSSTLSSSSINPSLSLPSNSNPSSGTSAAVSISLITSFFPSSSLASPVPSENIRQETSKRPSLVVILVAVFASLVSVTTCILAAIIYRIRRRRAAERSVNGEAPSTLQSTGTVSDQTTDDQDSTSLTPLRRRERGRARESKEPSFVPESEENLTTDAESSSRPSGPGGDSSAEIDFSAIPEEHEPDVPPPPYPGLDSDSDH
ncbi:hypothetical protein VNI00_000683 [Paramarasmius palmivorus]|uniref:Uncharacterized protein n=1 Tax=Paramarasmius palmivorus TaxID=297713 RepID=A0AAW0E6L3_9AGAR